MAGFLRTASVFLTLTLTPPALAQAPPLTLDDALRVAQANNSEVRRLGAEVDVAKAKLGGASLFLRGNPTIAAALGPRSSSAGRSLDYDVQISQQIEIAGQRGARMDSAASELAATEAQLQALRAFVDARVREQFGQVLGAAQRLQLAEEALSVAAQGVSAAEERFRAGAAALLEVNTARVELGRATRARAQAERAHIQALASLGFVVGIDPEEPVSVSGNLEQVADADTTGTPAELIRQALTQRADLRQSRSALAAANAEARLASREWIPSPRIGASYSHEEETSATIIQGTLSFELPLFNRNTATRGMTAARVRQFDIDVQTTARRIKGDVLAALARLGAARAARDGYAGDVVKAMQDNMELVTDSYRAGKIDFLQLVVIRRQAIEARGEYIDVLEELNSARAGLDLALGRTGVDGTPR